MGDQIACGKLSPWLRKKRVEIVRPFLNGRVLDIGCGVGYLAKFVPPENYVGIDIDEDVLMIARKEHPSVRFQKECPKNEIFDTIALLAVIEHVGDPAGFLNDLKDLLSPAGRIIVTTPHPSMKWIYYWGAKSGIFSKDALQEHEEFLGYSKVESIFNRAGLLVISYKRFLFGANQLFIAGKDSA